MVLRLTTYERSEDIPSLPGNNVFHSTALFRILEQTPGYKPLLIVAREGDAPKGKLLCITRHNTYIPAFTDKTYAYGCGEYFLSDAERTKRESVFNEMLSYLTERFGDRSFVLEFRNLEEPLFGYKYFRHNGYFPVKWLRVRNSIHHTALDKWMSASRKRQIARGLRNGVTLEVVSTPEETKRFFGMLRKYYSSKIHHYLPDLRFFLALLEQPAGEHFGKIFIVRFKDRIIGGSVCLFSGDTSYLMFSAGMRKSYPLCYPGVLAIWKAMTYARENGFEHFEFIDAGLPFKRYGYRDFILRFGGKQMSTRRWFKVRWEWLNKLLIHFYV